MKTKLRAKLDLPFEHDKYSRDNFWDIKLAVGILLFSALIGIGTIVMYLLEVAKIVG